MSFGVKQTLIGIMPPFFFFFFTVCVVLGRLLYISELVMITLCGVYKS